ncbi:MAG: hypothetical protein JNM78_05315 [Cyclobacteriaceae bacterium]|nr:hypothetical protein [Cyclobacteriaceae bacterium]
MKFYIHHTAELGSFKKTRIVNFLFNHPTHLQLQSVTGWHVFEYRDKKTDKVWACISFHLKAGEARCPLRAPFGSIELYRKLDEDYLAQFIIQVEEQLGKLGAKKIVIRNAPELYNEEQSKLLKKALLKSEFESSEEVSSVIHLDGKPFEKKIKISERQKLKKAASMFRFTKVNKSELIELYKFIATCRKERQQSLSMTLIELKKLVTAFPDSVLFFKVGTVEETTAAAIVIRVSKEVLYTFYYAHAKAHNRISPVVFLISGIYDFAVEHKYKMIDLGTSMIDRQINRSLLHFKKSIGGVTTRKLTFTKLLL